MLSHPLHGTPLRQPFLSWRKCVILGIRNSGSQRSGAPAMPFDEILAQIIDLLKRQGRVSYSALKRRFDLDDDYLNDLKDELLFAHPVVDEDNRGLVWTGGTISGQEFAAPSTQPTSQPAVQEQPSPEVTPRVAASLPPDAERRQLTVMFCDLV